MKYILEREIHTSNSLTSNQREKVFNRERKNGGRNGGKQEPLDRGMGNCERESGAQLPVEPPQPRPRWDLWDRRPRPRLQRHRQRLSHARRGCREAIQEILVFMMH